MCVFVCSSGLVPCTSWLGVLRGCVCLGRGCSRAPASLAGVLWQMSVCARAPLVPRHSWLGCAVWACVLGSSFDCAPPLLVGVLGCVCVPACAGLAPRHSWRGGCLCVWVWVSSAPRFSWPPGVGAGALGLLCAPRLFFGHLPRGRLLRWGAGVLPWVGFAPLPSPLVFLFGGGRRGVLCRGFVLLAAGCPGLGSRGHRPPYPSRSGCAFVCFSFSFSISSAAWCVSACSGCPLFWWAAALGSVLPVLAGWSSGAPSGSPVFSALCLGGLAASCGVHGRFCGCGPFSCPPPLFFFGGGQPVPPSAFPGLAHALVSIRCGQPGCSWCLRFARACAGSMGRVSYVHAWLGGPACWVRFWLCRLGGCARWFLEALGSGGGGLPCLSASAVPELTFWLWFVRADRHRRCRARDGPLPVRGGLVQCLPGCAAVSLVLVLWCAVVRRAPSCRVWPCCVVLAPAVLRCAVQCAAVLRRVMPRCAALCRVAPHCAVVCCVFRCLVVVHC